MDAGSAATSHAEFLLQQVRQNVDHLAATEALDPLLCRQLQMLLATAQVRAPPPPPAAPTTTVSTKEAAKDVKGKNKWMREVLSDTSALPTIVNTALTAAAGPMLTEEQRSAIVEIVKLSQSKIADAVTDPERQAAAQRWVATSSKSAQEGIRSSLTSAGENWDKWAKRQEQESAAQRAQRQAQKELEMELRREREQFTNGGRGSSIPTPTAPAVTLSTTADGLSQLSLLGDNPASASMTCMPSQRFQDTAVGPVAEVGALSTTFSPWPGLVLTMSTVASNVVPGEESMAADSGRVVPPPPTTTSRPSIHSQVAPPPRRAIPSPMDGAPLPPPPHPVSPLPPPPPPQHAAPLPPLPPTALRPGNPPPYQ
ncbi:hypothetical protein MNAN1_001202 [Malassezia nana]|uniref:Uncharacterized protein n=1 Tax=Malassezia nana TaxID=180528 RepID=A0AAF0EKJ1_9BASI|nr:hypothetical protein MNAN1_001202 [Malassezia nana]